MSHIGHLSCEKEVYPGVRSKSFSREEHVEEEKEGDIPAGWTARTARRYICISFEYGSKVAYRNTGNREEK